MWINLLVALYFASLASSLASDQLKALQLGSPNGVIQVTDDNFEAILNGPKDYYLVVAFTTLDDSIPCDVCRGFQTHFDATAYSYTHEFPDSDALYFANIEFTANRKAFSSLGMDNVPHIWVYPPSGADYTNATSEHYVYRIPQKPTTLDFAQFVAETATVRITVQEPDQLWKFARTFLGTLLLILVIKRRGPQGIKKFGKVTAYRVFSILLIILFTTGYSFTMMRGVPFVAAGENGEVFYISGGTSYQFGDEIFIVGANYLALAMTVVGLISVQKSEVDIKYKNAMTFLGAAAVYLLYSSLTSIYLRKDGGYPYGLSRLF